MTLQHKPRIQARPLLSKPTRYDIPPEVFEHIKAAESQTSSVSSSLAKNIYSSKNDSEMKSWFSEHKKSESKQASAQPQQRQQTMQTETAQAQQPTPTESAESPQTPQAQTQTQGAQPAQTEQAQAQTEGAQTEQAKAQTEGAQTEQAQTAESENAKTAQQDSEQTQSAQTEKPKEPEIPLAEIPEFSPAWEKDADELLPKPMIDLEAFSQGLGKHNIYDSASSLSMTDAKDDNKSGDEKSGRQVNISDMMMRSDFEKVHEAIDAVKPGVPLAVPETKKPETRIDPFEQMKNNQSAKQNSVHNSQNQPRVQSQLSQMQPYQTQNPHNQPQNYAGQNQNFPQNNFQQSFPQNQQNYNQQIPNFDFENAVRGNPAVQSSVATSVVPQGRTMLQLAKQLGPHQNQNAPMPTVFSNGNSKQKKNSKNANLNPVESLISPQQNQSLQNQGMQNPNINPNFNAVESLITHR